MGERVCEKARPGNAEDPNNREKSVKTRYLWFSGNFGNFATVRIIGKCLLIFRIHYSILLTPWALKENRDPHFGIFLARVGCAISVADRRVRISELVAHMTDTIIDGL